jgi:1-acyl-sn-glycerol-3-phosphate acyltransferase
VRTYYYISCLLIRGILKILWRYRRIGTKNIPPKGGVIIASNHAAYVDPPFIGAVCPRELHYLAKAELFAHPLFGWLIRKYNAIPITRGAFDRRAIVQAARLLREGRALLLFPEGTRGRGEDFLEPKLGVGIIACEAGVPIVPTYISSSNRLVESFLKRRRLVIGFDAPIEKDWISRVPKSKEGYKIIGQEIMNRVGALKDKIEKERF